MQHSREEKRKRKILILIAALIVFVAAISVAYFVISDKTETNEPPKITDPTVKFSEQYIPTTEDGDTFKYIIQAENAGKKAYYIRVKLNTNMSDEEEASWIKKNISDTWTYNDGYCYYSERLNVGETTDSLFKDVQTDDSFLVLKTKSTISIDESEYVEAEGYDSYIKAFSNRDKNS